MPTTMYQLETDAAPSRLSKMDFRKHLLMLDSNLASRDVKSLKFLCYDIVPVSALENVQRGLDLFQELEKKDKLSPDRMDILVETLYRIGRIDLISKLGHSTTSFQKSQMNKTALSPYRVLLFEVCEEICKKDLEQMKFMCASQFSKTKLETLKDAESFILALEQTEQLSFENLQLLEELLETIERADLAMKVKKFKRTQTTKSRPKNPTSSSESVLPVYEGENMYDVPGYNSLPSLQPGSGPVPTINGMDEWQQRVKDMYQEQMAQKKLEEIEGNRETLSTSPSRSPQEHDTERCYHVTDQPEGGESRQDSQSHTTSVPNASQGSRYLPQPMTNPSHVISQRPLGVSTHISPQPGPTSPAGISLRGPNSPAGISLRGPNSPAGISLREEPPSSGKVSQQGKGPTREQPLMAMVHTDAPRTNIISPGQNHPVQNTEHYQPTYTQTGRSGGANAVALQPVRGEKASTNQGTPAQQSKVATQPDNLTSFEDLPAYKMDSKPRGICLILNNQKFHKIKDDPESKQLIERTGSEYDCEKLASTFQKLGFVIRKETDLTRDRMVQLMYDLARSQEHKEYDCFMCCVLSHGALGSVYGSDGREVNIRELTDPFKGVICNGLRGKPKIFFIQACQGKQKQEGAPLHHDIETDAPTPARDFNPAETIPNEADFLLGFATVPGHVSFRSRTHGSWYITKLTEMLQKYAHRFDLLSILIKVNDEVSRGNAPMEEASYKQSPAPFATLRKKIYFK